MASFTAVALKHDTDRETEKRITIVLGVAFFIDAMSLIIFAIYDAVLVDSTAAICTRQECLTNESS